MEIKTTGRMSVTLSGAMVGAATPPERWLRKPPTTKLKGSEATEVSPPVPEIEPAYWLKPMAEDYVVAKFRALSQGLATKYFAEGKKVVYDFSLPGVLQSSVGMLKGAVVMVGHSTKMEDWVGRVTNSYWSGGDDGLGAPGMNADIQVDAVAAPKIARGLLTVPPIIDAVSVSVNFDGIMSHPDLDPDSFLDLQGQEVDGQIVRVLATKIYGYEEFSLVWAGADPLAVGLAEGDSDTDSDDNTAGPTTPANKTTEDFTMNEKLSVALSRAQGSLGDLKPEGLAVTDAAGTLDALVNFNAELTKKVGVQAAKIIGLEAVETAFSDVTDKLREEVVSMATFAQNGGPGEDKLLTVNAEAIAGMDHAKLLTSREDYRKNLDKLVPITCKACGSANLSRGSADLSEAAGTDEDGGVPYDHVIESLYPKSSAE